MGYVIHSHYMIIITNVFLDNAHALPKLKSSKKKYAARVVRYDHVHQNQNDTGVPYHFESAEKLVRDFISRVNKILNALE